MSRVPLLLVALFCAHSVVSHLQPDENEVLLRSQLEGNRDIFLPSVYCPIPVVIDVWPPVLSKSGQWIQVTVSGVQKPNETDVLAMYSPANSDPTKTSPVKYLFAKDFVNSDYLKTGEAKANFTVLNMHSDVAFFFFTRVGQKWDDGSETPRLVSKSYEIKFKNPEEPNQGHIALTGRPGEIRIMWASGYSPLPQFVKMGVDAQNLTHIFRGLRGGYNLSEMCGSPAKDWGWKEPGALYSAVASRLVPGKRYFYSFGNDKVGFSAVESFVAPRPVLKSSKIKFVAFGDLGKGHLDGSKGHKSNQESSIQTVNNIAKIEDNIDFVYHVGDISYARGYSYQWDEFMEQIRPVASKIPWMTLPGNHEIIFPDAGGECGVSYQRRFIMPHKYGKPWYSFNYGPVHFTTFSTEHDYQEGSEQYNWIETDLKSVDRTKTPWLVFSGHRPMYDLNRLDITSAVLQHHLEPLLDKYKVDVALWGHVHNYQRTCAVNKGVCDKSKTTHVVVGMGGFNLDKLYDGPLPPFIQAYHNDNGYSVIDVDEKSFKFQFFNNSNVLKDGFTLVK